MLPNNKLIKKEDMDMLKSSTDSSDKAKKVVDIKENSISKGEKPLSDDEYDDDYDYNYDDGDNDEGIVSITPKTVSTTKSECKRFTIPSLF